MAAKPWWWDKQKVRLPRLFYQWFGTGAPDSHFFIVIRHKPLIALASALLVLSAALTVYSTLLCSSISFLTQTNVFAEARSAVRTTLDTSDDGGFSNHGPGPEGQRHAQAVWCSEYCKVFQTGWSVGEGCCAGAERCSESTCKCLRWDCGDGNYVGNPRP